MGVQVEDLFKSKYTGEEIEAALDTFKNLASEYDPTQSYLVGAYVLHENKLYVCVNNTTVGTFNPSDWQEKTLSDLLNAATNTFTDPNNDGNIVIG